MGIAFSDYLELSITDEVGEMSSACMIAWSWWLVVSWTMLLMVEACDLNHSFKRAIILSARFIHQCYVKCDNHLVT